MATTTNQIYNGTLASVISSGSSVANGSNVLSATQDPQSAPYGKYPRGRFIFSGTFASAPTGNPSIQIFERGSSDGTSSNFVTDQGRSTTPVGTPLAVIALDTSNTTQTRKSAVVFLPVDFHQDIIVNGAGVSLNSGWSLSVEVETDQGV